MKTALLISACLFFVGCGTGPHPEEQITRVNYQWLDSIKHTADSSYIKKYGTSKFATAAYYIDKKNSTVCQVMKDSSDSIRQIIVTKNNKRSFFTEYYPNGQLVASVALDSFGQYHGAAKYFYQNGFVESEGDYKDGLKTGAWKNYDSDGKLVATSEYDANGQAR